MKKITVLLAICLGFGAPGAQARSIRDAMGARMDGFMHYAPGALSLAVGGIDDWDGIEELVATFPNITELDLGRNKLTFLHPAIGQLKNLEVLSMASNSLEYVPAEIKKLKKLRVLYLHANQLSDLPEEIGGLSCLQELYVQSNKLTAVPASIDRLKYRRVLQLCKNKFSGPERIGIKGLLPFTEVSF